FGLQFEEIRLMMTASDTIISGSAVTSLLPLEKPFVPSDLDFFARSARGRGVVKFLVTPGMYEVTSTSLEYGISAGIGTVWTLVHRIHGYKINVIEGLTTNPLDAVLKFHSTCVIGALTADGLWHAYPFFTLRGKALTTPNLLPLSGSIISRLEHQKTGWRVLHKYIDRGFDYDVGELCSDHICGVDWECPATVRRSDDAGCLNAPFPPWRFTSTPETAMLSAWTLGGVGCVTGMDDNKNRVTKPVYSERRQSASAFSFIQFLTCFEVCRWIRAVEALIGRATAPALTDDIITLI
ncbi:hypothetical protein C8R43DRAFT_902895, partial [Mycena crocata]